MFFPYRARINLFHTPWLTILVCLLCVWIFWSQFSNQRAIRQAADNYCDGNTTAMFLRAMKWLSGSSDTSDCVHLMMHLHQGVDERAAIATLVQRRQKAQSTQSPFTAQYESALLDAYRSFRAGAPTNLTARLAYAPKSGNPVRMVTAAFAHGDWAHLIGNLLFFFAFAATIEILLGPILFLAILLALALGTHVVYSLSVMGNAQALPTLGLSGVVMGMIALFVYFIPRARISCFIWLIIFYRRFAVPAWILAAWFIGWDIYYQASGGRAGVNLIAHLSGAGIGFLLGFTLFRGKRHWANELVEE